MAAAGPDPLFGLRNNFYIGAYQAAINNSDVPNLSQDDAVERDTLVYRSYIALGSYQVLIIWDLIEFFCDCKFFLYLPDSFFFSFSHCSLWSMRSMHQLLLHFRLSNCLLCTLLALIIRWTFLFHFPPFSLQWSFGKMLVLRLVIRNFEGVHNRLG